MLTPPIRISELCRAVEQESSSSPSQGDAPSPVPGDLKSQEEEPSLAIDFCGIRCENPFFLASSAVCTSYEMVARAFDMGWGGVFYKTICKQEIREVSPRFDAVKNGSAIEGFRNMGSHSIHHGAV